MTLPDRDVAVAWVGRTLVDRDGAEIGACTAVYADDATARAEWVCSELDGVAVLLPAVGATESGGQVQVLISRGDIAGAPRVDAEQHISIADEQSLYEHYGIAYSRDDSPSVLPADEPDGSGSAGSGPNGAPTDATVTSGSLTDTPSTPSSTTGTPNRSEPVDVPAVDRPQPLADTPDGGSRKALVSAGLAGLATLGGALAFRQLRRSRQRTRTERLADRGRAASTAVAGQLAPVLATARRRPAPTAGVASVLAALLAARRRRRSSSEDQGPYPTHR